MPETVNITIEPNEKYDSVIRGEAEMDEMPDTEEEWREQSEHHEAAEAYVKTIANTPDPEEMGVDPDELEPLSWDLLSVSDDPDLVAKMATYFEGMNPDEPTDELCAKLRLLDVDTYASVQIAAKAELRKTSD